jgi:hypothetical protein
VIGREGHCRLATKSAIGLLYHMGMLGSPKMRDILSRIPVLATHYQTLSPHSLLVMDLRGSPKAGEGLKLSPTSEFCACSL